MKKPFDMSADWINHTFVQRVNDCRCLLYLHGFMTESEMKKIDARIEKWFRKETQ